MCGGGGGVHDCGMNVCECVGVGEQEWSILDPIGVQHFPPSTAVQQTIWRVSTIATD